MNFRYIFISCLLLLNISCDDFLEVNPKGEIINDELFTTSEGFEDALYGCYASMNTENLYGKDLTWYILDAQSQQFSVTSSMNAVYKASIYDYDNEFEKAVGAKWRSLYEVIGYVNNLLEQAEKYTEKDFKYFNLYKGEALALRAFLHFEIVKLFAEHIERGPDSRGIPYVTKYSYEVTPFSTVKEVYGYILEDLLEAEKLLSQDDELMTYPRAENSDEAFVNDREIHLNKYAVQAILARVYWNKGEMNNALIYAEELINSGKFTLVEKTEIKDFIAGVLSPKETIWGLNSRSYLETTQIYLYNSTSHTSISPYNVSGGGAYPEPYTTLFDYDMEGETGTDFRLDHFTTVGENSSIRCLKVVDYEGIESGESSAASGGLIAGISMIRLPEMYYIAAEALLDTDHDKARKYFDKVLKSRGITPFELRAEPKALTIENINIERRKEFYCEGREWFNMKRQFRDIISNAEYKTIPASSEIYIWPIAIEEFDYRYND